MPAFSASAIFAMWPYMEYWMNLVSELFEFSFRSRHSLAIEAMQSSTKGLEDEHRQWLFWGPCLRVEG